MKSLGKSVKRWEKEEEKKSKTYDDKSDEGVENLAQPDEIVDPDQLWIKAIDAFKNGNFEEFADFHETLEILKVKNLYKDEQKELQGAQKAVEQGEEFEYKGTKGGEELGKDSLCSNTLIVNEMIDEK